MRDPTDRIERLIAFFRGELDEEENRLLRAKLSSDEELREMYSIAKQLMEESDEIDWKEIQAPLADMASRLIDDFHHGEKTPQRPRGVLVYDSRHLPLPEGVRPAAVDTRRLHYRFTGGEVNLSLYPVSPDSFEMIGRLTGDLPSSELTLQLKAGRLTFKTVSDQFHLFRFERIPRQSYELAVCESEQEIVSLTIEL